MSVTARYKSRVDVTEVVSATAASNPSVILDGFSSERQLSGTSTVPATKVAAFNKPLIAGAATIDLTALVGINGAAVNLTGLKVQIVKITAKTTNANDIEVTFGATNPYLLLGTDFLFTLKPGQEILLYLPDNAPDVATGAKTIDLAGTGTQSVDVIIVAG